MEGQDVRLHEAAHVRQRGEDGAVKVEVARLLGRARAVELDEAHALQPVALAQRLDALGVDGLDERLHILGEHALAVDVKDQAGGLMRKVDLVPDALRLLHQKVAVQQRVRAHKVALGPRDVRRARPDLRVSRDRCDHPPASWGRPRGARGRRRWRGRASQARRSARPGERRRRGGGAGSSSVSEGKWRLRRILSVVGGSDLFWG